MVSRLLQPISNVYSEDPLLSVGRRARTGLTSVDS